jgi:Cyanobacterial TRADD-N associated 2-Transmembrane domain
VAFAIILGGVGIMLGGLVTAGIVTTAASVIPQAGAVLLFNKDKELRRTIETYQATF